MASFQQPTPITHAQVCKIVDLKSRRNARSHSRVQVELIAKAITRFGWTTPVLVDEDNVVLAGYGRVEAAKLLGITEAPIMVARGWSDDEKRAYMLADNQIALKAGWDEELLKVELHDLKLLDFDLTLLGFDPIDLGNMEKFGKLERPIGSLADNYILPPFSILDTRMGWWQQRRRGWLNLGIQSELGRGDNALRFSDTILEPDAKRRNAAKGPAKEEGKYGEIL